MNKKILIVIFFSVLFIILSTCTTKALAPTLPDLDEEIVEEPLVNDDSSNNVY